MTLGPAKPADLLRKSPAIVLVGPRQAGKTTLAFAEKSVFDAATYLDLELPSAQRQPGTYSLVLAALAALVTRRNNWLLVSHWRKNVTKGIRSRGKSCIHLARMKVNYLRLTV